MKLQMKTALTGCIASTIVILSALYLVSPLDHKIPRNSFERKFIDGLAIQTAFFDLGFNSYYIAGVTANSVYLGNVTSPFRVTTMDLSSMKSNEATLTVTAPDSIINPGSFRLEVDSPNFFLTHGEIPMILRGSTTDWDARALIPDKVYFADAVPTSASSMVLRSYSRRNQMFELARAKVGDPSFEYRYGLLKKQYDGLFCVDGALHYAPGIKRVIYVYDYRNQYLVMDTSLNLLHSFNTIDTFSRAQIKVADITSRNYSMLSSPPLRINGNSCVSGKLLYIQSPLLSRNEDEERFRRSSVLDIYNLKEGLYLTSLFVDNYDGRRFSSFRIINNRLIAIFDRSLIIYSLPAGAY